MKKNAILILLALIMSFVLFSVSANAYGNTTIQTLNGSEFNTTTPAIQVTCLATNFNTATFNVSIYSVNNTFNNTFTTFLVANTTTVANGTSSYVTLDAITAPAEYYYLVDCFNSTNSGTGTIGNVSRNTSVQFFRVNARPTISSVTSTDGFIARNNPITFTIDWTDLNKTIIGGDNGTTATDATTGYVCNTNAFASDNSGCSGTQKCTSNLSGQETDGSTQCVYTVGLTETYGTKTAYAFVKDNNDYVSASTAVTYKVAGTSGYVIDPATGQLMPASVGVGGTATAAASQQNGGSKTLIIALIVIVAVILGAAYLKNKK